MVARTGGAGRAAPRSSRRSLALGFGSRWRDFDFFILFTTMVLMTFGAVAIWSASGGGSLHLGNPGVRQGLYGALGLALMLFVASFDYRFLASFAWPLYGVGILSLVLVLVPGIGAIYGGSQRWFDLGFTTVQPSEFAKLTTMIVLAAFIASRGPAMREPGNFIISALIVLLPMVLVFRQPDLGTSLVFGVIWASMIGIAQTRKLFIAGAVILALPSAMLAWQFLLADYHKRRVLVFLDPESDPTGDGFNVLQAKISIGSGGLRGYGLLGGSQSQLDLLSVRQSDFIFAHASGMFGFIGMLALFAAFIILLWRCLYVVQAARDSFGQCLAVSVTGVMLFQAFVNIGMNVGLMPVTGITLPFVSAGLSSLWTFLFAEGILQSILMHHRKLAFQRG